MEQRVDARGLRDRDRGARRSPVAHVVTHALRSGGAAGVSRRAQAADVLRHRLRQVDAPGAFVEGLELGQTGDRLGLGRPPVTARLHDLGQDFGADRLDQHLKQEAVQLRFREGIGALHLDRVLRRQHEEGLRQITGFAQHGHAALGHGLEQRRLRLG